ncbi:MAG: hypothetical protein ACFFFH_17730 [Candidatus Thorarchaeota archaeon]
MQLIHYSRLRRVTLLMETFFSILNKWFDLAPPFLIVAAVDIAVRHEGSIFGSLGITDVPSQLIFLGGLIFKYGSWNRCLNIFTKFSGET